MCCEEACAFVCFIFSAIGTILSWSAMQTGDRGCIVITLIFAVVVILTAGYALASKFL